MKICDFYLWEIRDLKGKLGKHITNKFKIKAIFSTLKLFLRKDLTLSESLYNLDGSETLMLWKIDSKHLW